VALANVALVAIRCQCQEETKELIHAAGVPYFTTSMSKGFDENLPKFGGIYGGLASPKPVREAIESADCILWVGSYSVRSLMFCNYRADISTE